MAASRTGHCAADADRTDPPAAAKLWIPDVTDGCGYKRWTFSEWSKPTRLGKLFNVRFLEYFRPRPWVAPETRLQFGAQQPSLITIILAFVVPLWIPTAVAWGLLHVQLFRNWVLDYPTAYSCLFDGVQIALIFGASAFLAGRFAAALWIPSGSFWKSPAATGLLFLSLCIYQFYRFDRLSHLFLSGAEAARPAMPEFVAQVFESVWTPFHHGTSLYGVIAGSIIALIVRPLEVLVFCGLIANRLAVKARPLFVILGTGVCFAIPSFLALGSNVRVLIMVWVGATLTALRINSGSIAFVICTHVFLTVFDLLPKWGIAWMHFRLSGY